MLENVKKFVVSNKKALVKGAIVTGFTVAAVAVAVVVVKNKSAVQTEMVAEVAAEAANAADQIVNSI